MTQNWFQRIRVRLEKSRRRADKSRFQNKQGISQTAPVMAQLELLEPRQMLSSNAVTNVVGVNFSGGTLTLADHSPRSSSTGDNFTVSYTSTHVVLTGTNGTQFKVGSTTESTYTLNISSAISISMSLNRNANTVTLTGDGTATLNNLNFNLGPGRQTNSLTLTDVIAQNVSVNGGGKNSTVTITGSQVKQNLRVNLGYSSGDTLNLTSTTITGNTTLHTGELNVSHTTFTGTLTDWQLGNSSVYNSTDSIYKGTLLVELGKSSVLNYLYSPDGSNHIEGKSTFVGRPGHNAQIYQGLGSTTNNIPATIIEDTPGHLIHVDEHVIPIASTASPPTVNALAAATTTPTITGTYTPSSSTVFTVTVNGTTYTLGTSSQLTAPTTGNWSLNLTGSPLPTTTTSFTVTAASFDKWGNEQTGTGTVTNEQAIITKYLTAQNLTASDVKTASGLNYVVTTQGAGALPTAGQTIAAQYTGHILNSDGTLGSEFDSNVDGTHPADPNPFTFTLGAGQVIKGWDEAFALLHVGSSATLILPSSLAYGTNGTTGIPANSILVFTVKLVSAT